MAQSRVLGSALLRPEFAVAASGLDGGVKLTFAGSPLPMARTVLTYGAQCVIARLPAWAEQRCGLETYPIRLRTGLGPSNQASLEVTNKPCPFLTSPNLVTHVPPPR
jgi:hypothetical protein